MFCRITVLIAFTILSSAGLHAQQNSIGVRIGDPMGLTYKRFVSEKKAVEFVIGSVPKNWLYTYYRKSFYDRDKYDGYRHRDHKVNSTFYLQARMVFHYPIVVENLGGALSWYWGIGATFKIADIDYIYADQFPPVSQYYDSRTDIDFGPDGMIGLEYTFKGVPVATYLEISSMLELFDRPFALRILPALGVRYKF